MEFARFVSQSPNHFWGFVIVLVIALNGVAKILRALKGGN